MLNSQYTKRDVKKYFFMLPNEVFDLDLHVYELAIYAYLLRIEDRRTYQCIVSYPTIADKLGISVNTVAKYVAKMEEHGLVHTEHTDITTKEGLKRNGCLKYTILPIRYAIDIRYKRKVEELQRTADIQKTKEQAAKKGIKVHSPDDEQSA